MTGPGFAAEPAAVRQRAEQVARVEQDVRRAVAAASVASAPKAFGLLCSFFPALLDPAHTEARAALDQGAAAARAVADAVRASAGDYERGDADGAATVGGG